MRRAFAALAAASFLLLSGSEARANGRFPESNHIFFSSDPDFVLLRVTFGAIVSHDRGKTWGWVCEASIGSAGVEDPMYAFTPNGTIMATTFKGLSVSKDQACSFDFAGDPLNGQTLIDLTSHPDDRKDVVVFASAYDTQDDAGNILFKSQLFETKDEGGSFVPLGAPLDPTVLGETVDVTATDPDRLYVSAVKDPGGAAPAGALLTSHDRGATWESATIPLQNGERAIYIAAADPTNADRVYLRTLNAADQPSRVIVTDDAGKTFKTVFDAKGSLPGFALSSDGSKIWVGGPLDGVQAASTTDFAFTQRSTLPVQCLAVNADGLWACSNEKAGFVAGLSHDDGATFEAKLHFCDITGPLACPAGTETATACAKDWPVQQATLGCTPGADAGADAGAADGGEPMGHGGGGGCDCVAAPQGASWPVSSAAIGAGALAVAGFLRRRARRARRTRR